MSPAQSRTDIFDVKKVTKLIELMKEHDLSEIDLKQGETAVRLKRGGDVVMAASPTHNTPIQETPTAARSQEKQADDKMLEITSPMVGTFYQASGPEAAPFIKIGDRIGPEKTVCIVEAMKVFNEIPAGVSGQVVAILVENGAPVEFGQPLIKVDPEA
ncbi:MAG: acetyl-CoA carboxylase biotin carboxyl carrier protein [Pirellulales bacterium]